MTAKSKTILITGSTDGVRRYVAERLATEGWRVIVHGRDRIRGEAVIEQIAKQGGEARLLTADLASLAEVRSLADAVLRDEASLDALVNNAGIGTSGSRRELSADGFELRFAVNYLAGFLLTRAPAHAGDAQIGQHRQRFFSRTAGDRLFRRDAHSRL